MISFYYKIMPLIDTNDLNSKEIYNVDDRLLKETNKSICDNLITNYKSLNKNAKENFNFEEKINEDSKDYISQIDEKNLTKNENNFHNGEEDVFVSNKLLDKSINSSKENIIYDSDNDDNKFNFENNLSESKNLLENLNEDNILENLTNIDKYSIETQNSKSSEEEDLKYIFEK